jgi:hypothetical protein
MEMEARLGDDGDDVRDSDFDALEQEVATAVQLVQMSNDLPQNNQVAETPAVFDASPRSLTPGTACVKHVTLGWWMAQE